MADQWLAGIPIQTAKWRIRLLRLIYRRWWAVYVRGKLYILREPPNTGKEQDS